MSPKNEIANKINEFFEFIGVDSLLGTVFLGLVLCSVTIKEIKNWRDLSSFQRTMYFVIWFSTIIGIITVIVRFIREG